MTYFYADFDKINEIFKLINKNVYITIKYITFDVNHRRVRKIFINKIKKTDVINLKM